MPADNLHEACRVEFIAGIGDQSQDVVSGNRVEAVETEWLAFSLGTLGIESEPEPLETAANGLVERRYDPIGHPAAPATPLTEGDYGKLSGG